VLQKIQFEINKEIRKSLVNLYRKISIDTRYCYGRLNWKFLIINTENICCKYTWCADGCCSDGCETCECTSTCCKDGCCADAENCCE